MKCKHLGNLYAADVALSSHRVSVRPSMPGAIGRLRGDTAQRSRESEMAN